MTSDGKLGRGTRRDHGLRTEIGGLGPIAVRLVMLGAVFVALVAWLDNRIDGAYLCAIDPDTSAAGAVGCSQTVLSHIADLSALVVFAAAIWQTLVLAAAADLTSRARAWARLCSSLAAAALIYMVFWALADLESLSPISVMLSVVSLVVVADIDRHLERVGDVAGERPVVISLTDAAPIDITVNAGGYTPQWLASWNRHHEWNFGYSDENKQHLVKGISTVLGTTADVHTARAVHHADALSVSWGALGQLDLDDGQGHLRARVSAATARGLDGILELLAHASR